MELRQLRYLVALADERNFTRAARREHVAQPALSQQIRRLEAEVGLPLVDRTTRRASLTEAGEILVERARRALAEIQAGEAELAELAGIRAGRVAIGAMQTLGPFDLPLLLALYHGRYPEVELAVHEEPSEDLAERLRSDELDVAFLSVTRRIKGDGLEFKRLATEEVVAVLPHGHPLAHRDTLRTLLFDAAHDAGFEPRVAFESNEVGRIRRMVARGLGVSILPLSDVEGSKRVSFARLTEPPLSRDLTLVWRADRRHGPAARAFLEMAQMAEELGTTGRTPY